MVLTSVRVPFRDHEWVMKNGYQFSALLRIKIAELRGETGTDSSPAGRLRDWLGERNRAGLITTAEEIEAKKKEFGLAEPK